MKLPLKEPLYARYLYLSPENIIHIFMPIVSGTTIGLDNTCKAVYALQEFFDKGHNGNKKVSLRAELLAYQEALESDISLLGASSPLSLQKQERLSQIEAYLKVLELMEKHLELNCLNSGFPSYPRPLEYMIKDRTTSNLYSMVLHPEVQDGYLRTEGVNPIFFVAHKSVLRNIVYAKSQLQKALIDTFTPLTFHDLKATLIKQVVAQLEKPFNFATLTTLLHKVVYQEMAVAIDFLKNAKGVLITQDYIDKVMHFDKDTKPEQYIAALFGFCAPDLFTTTIVSPFKYLTQAEQWSIATQFLLGLTNIYAVAKGKTDEDINWGEILDNRPELSIELAQTLAQAHQDNASIEETCLLWLNKRADELTLKTLLSLKDIQIIKHDVAVRYVQIKDAPHFDEFFILDSEKQGPFVIHQGSIGTSFVRFVHSSLLAVTNELLQPLEKAQQQALNLSGTIPHKNTLVQNEIEISTATLDNVALQILYKQISCHRDPALKERLIAQLNIEHPYLKAQINAKLFLQQVAFGQQDEAEKLLQQDEELVQELLTVKDIPFTDYSGRTFTCSAYEYAWWAKDSHMRFMLERYMNEHTRKELLKRVQHLEEPISKNAFFKRTRGLVYTQQGKEYCTAHFDLTPLKRALKDYIEAYEEISKNKAVGLEALDVFWMNVGLTQREVPAHIAQEYCYVKRSFSEIVKNSNLLDASNPANLGRELILLEWNGYVRNNWFPLTEAKGSGLGSSFAIVRAQITEGVGFKRGSIAIKKAPVDLAAIKVIDEVRTNDLEQSRKRLAIPSKSQTSNPQSRVVNRQNLQ